MKEPTSLLHRFERPPDASSDPNADSPEPLRSRWWILLGIGLGTLMTALDGSVVNITLPVIGQTLCRHAEAAACVSELEWIVTIYLLVLTALLLSFGRLGDLWGHKSVYLAGFGIFVLSSILCSLAPSIPILILCRAIQAFGGAMLAANSPAILTKNFPASERGRALGLQATMTYLGLTIGPTLGGWLTDHLGWRAVFYINVPFGALAVWLSWRYIQPDRPAEQPEHFDLAGAATFMVALICLLLGLNQGHAWGWSSPPILALLGGAALLSAIFLRLESRLRFPMLDLTLFRNLNFTAAVSSAVLNYICVYSVLFLMPFYLQQGRSFSPAQAGMILTAQPIIMALIAPISGAASDRIGTRLPSQIGMVILAVGCLLLSRLGASSSLPQITLALGVVGLGTGMFISPNNSALMGAAPRHRQGIAAGVLATARNFGMVLGVGFTGAIFSTLASRSGASSPTAGQALAAAALAPLQLTFAFSAAFAMLGALAASLRR